jgi:hypothetical protein
MALRTFALLVLCQSLVWTQSNPDVLTNDTIFKLVSTGVPTETIIQTIQSAHAVKFSFQPYDQVGFQAHKIPDEILKAMAARSNNAPISTAALPPPPPSTPQISTSNTPGPQQNINPAPRTDLRTSKVLDVVIIDRQSQETDYSYVVPGYFTSNANANANCFGVGNSVNCNGSARTTGVSVPAQQVSFHVNGATFALQIPDGRVVVVNCESKFAERFAGPRGNRRSCRTPIVDQLQAEFNGDKAKLEWSVSLDGKKLESETYKILGVLDKK